MNYLVDKALQKKSLLWKGGLKQINKKMKTCFKYKSLQIFSTNKHNHLHNQREINSSVLSSQRAQKKDSLFRLPSNILKIKKLI
jgi:hypothetical protein